MELIKQPLSRLPFACSLWEHHSTLLHSGGVLHMFLL